MQKKSNIWKLIGIFAALALIVAVVLLATTGSGFMGSLFRGGARIQKPPVQILITNPNTLKSELNSYKQRYLEHLGNYSGFVHDTQNSTYRHVMRDNFQSELDNLNRDFEAYVRSINTTKALKDRLLDVLSRAQNIDRFVPYIHDTFNATDVNTGENRVQQEAMISEFTTIYTELNSIANSL